MSLPQGWVRCRLEELLANEAGALTDGPFGSSLKSEHYVDAGCRVIRLNNVGAGRFNDTDSVFIDMSRFQALRRHAAEPGDLVTAALGEPLGRTCLVPEGIGPAIVKADCFRTRLDPRIDVRLIAFWLNSDELARYFGGKGKGVGRVRINTRALRDAPIPLPPAERQRAIANRLEHIEGRAQAARGEAAKAVKASEALRRSGLRAGVTGTLTAKWRQHAGFGESLDEVLARVAPPLQDRGGRAATDVAMAGIGAIAVNDPQLPLPEGWQWVPLTRVAAQGTGHTPSRKRDDYWGGDVPWLGIPDARDHHGGVVMDTVKRTTAAGLAGSSARMLTASTVCLSRTASVGYVTILGRPMATSQDFVTWTCSDALIPEYLMFALMAEGRGIGRFGRGSTHTTIYMPELRAFHIALPPPAEQRAIVAQIRRILAKAEVLRAAAAAAVRTAERLLPQAVGYAMAGGLEPGRYARASAAQLVEELRRERQAMKLQPRAKAPGTGEDVGMEQVVNAVVPPGSAADLVAMVRVAGGEMQAAALWRQTGLEIQSFYRLLAEAVDAGDIVETADKELLRAS